MGPVLIVAHGQPSDPAPAAEALDRLAVAVGAQMPGRLVAAATLAQPGALAAALECLGPGGVVYPMFMAGGWFTRVYLPAQLSAAGAVDWRLLEPFGCDPAVHDLAVQVAAESGTAKVVLAAHGSFKSRVPSDIARHVAGRIAAAGVPVVCGFIDQEPQLATVALGGAGAVCLPFFAAEGGHVTEDIPAALAKAGFEGRLLPALGVDPRVPGLIAAAVRADQPVCTRECRWHLKDG